MKPLPRIVRETLIARQKLIKLGFAGKLKTGEVVDIRRWPNAIPIEKIPKNNTKT